MFAVFALLLIPFAHLFAWLADRLADIIALDALMTPPACLLLFRLEVKATTQFRRDNDTIRLCRLRLLWSRRTSSELSLDVCRTEATLLSHTIVTSALPSSLRLGRAASLRPCRPPWQVLTSTSHRRQSNERWHLLTLVWSTQHPDRTIIRTLLSSRLWGVLLTTIFNNCVAV